MQLFLILLIPALFWVWSPFYRWAFFPKRDPDFEHKLYVYWFDEKVAYSRLSSRKKMLFYENKGILYEDFGSNQKYVDLFGNMTMTGMLPFEVQMAYKQHVTNKFEEIVLK